MTTERADLLATFRALATTAKDHGDPGAEAVARQALDRLRDDRQIPDAALKPSLVTAYKLFAREMLDQVLYGVGRPQGNA